jgi:[ribosomal protein S5]-alanine N-acetyltransferase
VDLVVMNTGSGPAKNISFEFSDPIQSPDGFVISDMRYLAEGMESLAPKSGIACQWGDMDGIISSMKEQGLTQGIAVSVSYEDLVGKSYNSGWNVNPTLYEGNRDVTSRDMVALVDTMEGVSDTLHRISDNLEGLGNRFGRADEASDESSGEPPKGSRQEREGDANSEAKENARVSDTLSEVPAFDRSLLETSNLVLRPLGPKDLDLAHGLFNHPEIDRYLWDGVLVSTQTASEYLAQSERGFAASGLGLFAVYLRDGDRLAGFCGFRPSSESGQPELLYALLPEWRGRGLATEATRKCLRLAFEEVGVRRVLASVDSPNEDSVRLLERLGMSPAEDAPRDDSGVLYYALTRDEFEGGAL